MDYTGWPQPPQNPNPSADSTHWYAVDYSAGNYHNFYADAYQLPSIYPYNAFFQPPPPPPPPPPPQPHPPGVDPAYVPPPVTVTYVDQAVNYVPQQSAAVAPGAYYPDPNGSWAASVNLIGSTPNVSGVAAPTPPIQSQKRNTKKKSQKKTKVVQSVWCEVCQIDCNSKGVLDQHKLGKKHKKNLEKLKWTTSVPEPCIAATPTAGPVTSHTIVAAPATSQAVVAAPPAASATSQSIVAASPAATVTSQPNAASPPAATVTSQPIVAVPIAAAASPHAIVSGPPAVISTSVAVVATVPASEVASTALPVSASAPIDKTIIGPEENPEKPKASNSKKSRKKVTADAEDLETKRRKMLEGGAAADLVRVCSVCNVVCNSDTVFNYHIAGQKHASMVKKQARARVA